MQKKQFIEWEKDSVWIWEKPLRFVGIPFGTRMTVIRLKRNELFVHSPIEITDEVQAEVNNLGTVRYIVSPNKLHHLYMKEWVNAYPKANIYASPGLSRKRKDIRFKMELQNASEPEWKEEIDQIIVQGSFALEEVVFFHRQSRTLLIADICEYFGPHSPSKLTRALAYIAGMYNRPIMPPDWRFTFWNKTALRESLHEIMMWDFSRIILAHGKLITSGAKAVFKEAFSWALQRNKVRWEAPG